MWKLFSKKNSTEKSDASREKESEKPTKAEKNPEAESADTLQGKKKEASRPKKIASKKRLVARNLQLVAFYFSNFSFFKSSLLQLAWISIIDFKVLILKVSLDYHLILGGYCHKRRIGNPSLFFWLIGDGVVVLNHTFHCHLNNFLNVLCGLFLSVSPGSGTFVFQSRLPP